MTTNHHHHISPNPEPEKTSAYLLELYDRLFSRYQDPHWWPAKTSYEMMVGAILTQNTAWHNVEKALANFSGNLSPEYVQSLSREKLADLIRPAGFMHQKARYLHALTQWFSRYRYDAAVLQVLPQDRVRKELLSLKGVGRETADAILLYAFRFPSFVVDAYTMRLLERLPLLAGNSYDAVKAFLEQHLPREEVLFNRFHALIVLNAKEHCKKKPLCTACPVLSLCQTGKRQQSDRKMAVFWETPSAIIKVG